MDRYSNSTKIAINKVLYFKSGTIIGVYIGVVGISSSSDQNGYALNVFVCK